MSSLVCLSGCVLSSTHEALKLSFNSYVTADQKKLNAIEMHFNNHDDQDSLLIQLQLKGCKTWQKRINKAKEGLTNDNR